MRARNLTLPLSTRPATASPKAFRRRGGGTPKWSRRLPTSNWQPTRKKRSTGSAADANADHQAASASSGKNDRYGVYQRRRPYAAQSEFPRTPLPGMGAEAADP